MALALAWAVLCAAGCGWAAVRNVHIKSNRCVDTWSPETIVATVCNRLGMSDQERCIALWEFVARSMFHHATPADHGFGDRWPNYTLDGMKLLNVYGFSLCTPMSVTLGMLFEAAGYEAEIIKLPGHSIVHVKYDNSWHAFDPMMAWYVLKPDGSVAGCQDIAEKPSLILNAQAEGRASNPFCPCGDKPEWLAKAIASWSSFGPGSVNKPRWKPDYVLRQGEELCLLWDNEGKFWSPRTPKGSLPVHSCSINRDRAWPAFEKYWAPYVKTIAGRQVVRYWTTSRLTYEPNLRTPSFREGVTRSENLAQSGPGQPGPALHPAQAGEPASVTFRVASQYVFADATLRVGVVRKGEADLLAVSVSVDGGRTWRSLGQAPVGEREITQSLTSFVAGYYQYLLRFELRAASDPLACGIDKLKLEHLVMANAKVFPQLFPGENRITIEVANPEELANQRVEVEFAWFEGETLKTLRKTLRESPTEFTITVWGETTPKMRHIRIACRPK